MWFKEYRDYPIDKPLVKEQVESGHGIIGCEMHEINGWGTHLHQIKPRKKGIFSRLMSHFFREKNQHGSS
jgi:hypothetical protein